MRIDARYMGYAFHEGAVNVPGPGPTRLFGVSIGSIFLRTGRLVACDPLVCLDALAFSQPLPVGHYPVLLRIADFGSDQRVAFAAILLDSEPVTSWQLLCRSNQDPASLGDDEYFGYPVDSGTGAFMDDSTRLDLEQRYASDQTYSDYLIAEMGRHYVDTWDWAVLQPNPEEPGNLFAFHSGYGDGIYPTLLGLTASGNPAAVVTDFMVFDPPTEDCP